MNLNGAKLKNFYGISTLLSDDGDENAKGVILSHYQRPYRWESEHIEKLIHDWADNKLKNSSSRLTEKDTSGESFKYFSGCVVSVFDSSNHHQLVDGQQRITTLFLANFMLFLISREMVFKMLRGDASKMRFNSCFEILLHSSRFIFNDFSYNRKLTELKQKLEQELEQETSSEDKGDNNNIALNSFLNLVPVFLEKHKDIDKDIDIYQSRMRDLLIANPPNDGSKNLFLTYTRKSFNSYIKNILSSTVYSLRNDSKPSLDILKKNADSRPLNVLEEKYFNSLNTIFTRSKNLIDDLDLKDTSIKSWELAKHQLDLINRFMYEVNFCLVQTNSKKDAYKLFEVLNDRALALDDLDLIKNLFYQQFVEINTPNDDDESKESKIKEIDDHLDLLDNQWVERIFPPNMGIHKKKLITLFAITYITGSQNLKYNTNSDYRDALATKFKKNPHEYTFRDIQRDFNIFYTCTLFVDYFELTFKKKDLKALEAQYKPKLSVTVRTVHFLNALNQEGVLSALVNSILRFIQNQYPYFLAEDPNKQIEFKDSIHEIFSNIVSGTDAINQQAKHLWQYSMYSKDAKGPRDFAKKVISKNNLESPTSEIVKISTDEQPELEETFTGFLMQWQYKEHDSKNSFKPRILFAILVQADLDKKQIKVAQRQLPMSPEECAKLELDHMEPNKIELSNEKQYFQHSSRQIIVNGIGNMMPIDKVNNGRKGNAPLTPDTIEYYSFIGDNQHFLLAEISNFLESYGIREGFFNERRDRLIELFKQGVKL